MSPDEFDRLQPVIGLSLCFRLRTKAKLFSAAPIQPLRQGDADQDAPNARTHPLDLGHPGTLPVLNERALLLGLRLGLATDCEVAPRPAFVREHAFRPELPKGYRLTQREDPLCYGGFVELPDVARAQGDGQPATRRVRLRRLHLEEDTGEVAHLEDGTAGVDYNRAGAPLLHLVTEPDLRSPREAVLLLKKVQQLARYLDVSDARLSDGSLRCNATLALRRRGGEALEPSAELRDAPSTEALRRALRYEIARQARRVERSTSDGAETRRWDEKAKATRPAPAALAPLAPDAYLPDPDLPPLEVGDALLERARASMPEQPGERRQRLVDEIGLPQKAAARLTEDRALADFYEASISQLYKFTGGGNTRRQAQRAAHFLLTEGRRALSQHRAGIDALPITPRQAAKVVYMLLEDDLPDAEAAGEVFAALLAGKEAKDPEAVAREKDILAETDGREALEPLIEQTLKRHSKNVHKYKSGNKGLMKSFVGEVRSAFEEEEGEKADDDLIREMIEERLH